jgi:hypothetical protein
LYGFPTACASDGRRVDAKVVQVGLLVAPMAWWGDTAQPVLTSVTHTYLPQFVGHTPYKPHANRIGLVMDCTSDTRTRRKLLTRPDRPDVVTRTMLVTNAIVHVEVAKCKSQQSS